MHLDSLQRYLREVLDPTLEVLSLQPASASAFRAENFSEVYFALVRDSTNQEQQIVIKKVIAKGFGLDEPADRARHLLWCYSAYTALPRHPNALDVGFIRYDGQWVSMAQSQDYFLIEEFVEGRGYYEDLAAILDRHQLTEQDNLRARALALYLSELHQEKKLDPIRYTRALRELIGGGEGIMGLIEAFPADFKRRHFDILLALQKQCLERVWQIAQAPRPLSQTHGDFHPWNILFRSGDDFSVIDRSRSAWDDPAVDVGSMAMNYLFLGIREGNLAQSAGRQLLTLFLETYLSHSRDDGILTTLGPHLAMRATAVASPIFYPFIPEALRLQLFAMALHLVQQPVLSLDVRSWTSSIA